MAGPTQGDKPLDEEHPILEILSSNINKLIHPDHAPSPPSTTTQVDIEDVLVIASRPTTTNPQYAYITEPPSLPLPHTLDLRQNNPQDCTNLIIASVNRATVEISRTIIALNATFTQQLEAASISASNGIKSAQDQANATITVISQSASSATSSAFSSITIANLAVTSANLALTSAQSSASTALGLANLAVTSFSAGSLAVASSSSSDVSVLSGSIVLLQASFSSVQASASEAIAAAQLALESATGSAAAQASSILASAARSTSTSTSNSPASALTPQIVSMPSSAGLLTLTPAQAAGILIGTVVVSVVVVIGVYWLLGMMKKRREVRDSYLDEKGDGHGEEREVDGGGGGGGGVKRMSSAVRTGEGIRIRFNPPKGSGGAKGGVKKFGKKKEKNVDVVEREIDGSEVEQLDVVEEMKEEEVVPLTPKSSRRLTTYSDKPILPTFATSFQEINTRESTPPVPRIPTSVLPPVIAAPALILEPEKTPRLPSLGFNFFEKPEETPLPPAFVTEKNPFVDQFSLHQRERSDTVSSRSGHDSIFSKESEYTEPEEVPPIFIKPVEKDNIIPEPVIPTLAPAPVPVFRTELPPLIPSPTIEEPSLYQPFMMETFSKYTPKPEQVPETPVQEERISSYEELQFEEVTTRSFGKANLVESPVEEEEEEDDDELDEDCGQDNPFEEDEILDREEEAKRDLFEILADEPLQSAVEQVAEEPMEEYVDEEVESPLQTPIEMQHEEPILDHIRPQTPEPVVAPEPTPIPEEDEQQRYSVASEIDDLLQMTERWSGSMHDTPMIEVDSTIPTTEVELEWKSPPPSPIREPSPERPLILDPRDRTLSPLRRNPVDNFSSFGMEPLPPRPQLAVMTQFDSGPSPILMEQEEPSSQSIDSLISPQEEINEPPTPTAEPSEREQRGRSMLRTSDIISARSSVITQPEPIPEEAPTPITSPPEQSRAKTPVTELRKVDAEERNLSPLRRNPFDPSNLPLKTLISSARDRTISPLRRNPVDLFPIPIPVLPSLPTPSATKPTPTPLKRLSRSLSPRPSFPLNHHTPPPQPELRKPTIQNTKPQTLNNAFSSTLSKFQTLVEQNPGSGLKASTTVTQRAIAGIYIPGSLREEAVRNFRGGNGRSRSEMGRE